jgi:membrane-associated protein
MIFDPSYIIHSAGLLGIFIIILIESGFVFGFFLPGDTLLFSAGIFAHVGLFFVQPLIVLCISAAIIGGYIGYFSGKKIGPRLFKKEESLFFKKKYVKTAEDFYNKYGNLTILFARFIPFVRTFSPIIAGIGNMPKRTFTFFNIIGGIFWPTIVILLGYYVGEKIPYIEFYLLPIMLGVIALSVIPLIIPLVSKVCGNK